MDDQLLPWLRTQIAARRERAEAATPGPWYPWDRGVGWEIANLPDVNDGTTFTKADAAHIVDNDPAAVLAQCEAHTRILDEVVPRINAQDDQIEREWGSYDQGSHDESDLLIRLLASCYAGNPGYRPEWKP